MAAKCISLALALMAFLFLSNVESKRFRLQERILGGVTAAKGQFPYMVSLINRQNEFPVCGGAIINNFYTVSSAYCVDAYKTYPELLVLYLGAWKLRETVFRDVDKVRLHPQYNASTKQNDIALLRTKNKIVFSNLLKPISLPTENFPNENGEKLIVSGFGLWFVSIARNFLMLERLNKFSENFIFFLIWNIIEIEIRLLKFFSIIRFQSIFLSIVSSYLIISSPSLESNKSS